MQIDVFKSLHIIFVVSWFAGLFYIFRLFIYAQEALDEAEPKKTILVEQLILMQRKLWWIITTPAMGLTVGFGIAMLIANPAYLKMDWMHIKLGFVALLLAYHFYCQKIMFDIAKGVCTWKSTQLRIWNEVATLFLVAIVFIVVMKSSMNWIYGTLGFFGVAIALMVAIQWYKKARKR